MYDPQYLLKSFETLPVPSRMTVMGRLLDVLVRANVADMEGRQRPPLSVARATPNGAFWQDAAHVIETGVGTCPSLVAWRVAALRKAGEQARWILSPTGQLWVERANGVREDAWGGGPGEDR